MTKDFKKKQNSDSPFNDVTSWLLAGIALGLFIGLMVYIFSGSNANQPTEHASTVSTPPVVGPASNTDLASRDVADTASQNPAGNKSQMATLDQIVAENLNNSENDKRPTFDYHVILPTLDVEVPVARPTEWKERDKKSSKEKEKKKESKEKKRDKPKKTQKEVVEKITKPGNYVIQVGAYRTEADAIKMKNRVGDIGVSAYAQKAVVKGTTWYRVRIGPISDLNKVNRIRNQLSSRGIASFKKKVK